MTYAIVIVCIYYTIYGQIQIASCRKYGEQYYSHCKYKFAVMQAHTLLPLRKAVIIQSEQKRWRHSLVVMVFFSISRQMGHMSSLCRLRGLTAISVLSVIASCGVRCNSQSDNSHVLLRPTCSADAILDYIRRTRSIRLYQTIGLYTTRHTTLASQQCVVVLTLKRDNKYTSSTVHVLRS